MKITWYGHACFGVESEGYRVVLDPYEGVKGYGPLDLTANEVLCSHEHFDHCCRSAVTLEGAKSPFRITSAESFHDDCKGELRGKNTIHILRSEGLTVVHLGDLGHPLTKELIVLLRGCDVLLVPVGGTYTIDAEGAKAAVDELNPRIVVPMHYRRGNLGFDNIGSLDDFLKLFRAGEIHELEDNGFTVTPDLSGVVVPVYRP